MKNSSEELQFYPDGVLGPCFLLTRIVGLTGLLVIILSFVIAVRNLAIGSALESIKLLLSFSDKVLVKYSINLKKNKFSYRFMEV